MIRLLIADDHAIVRAGLKQIFALVPEIDIVGEAETAEQLMSMLHSTSVDLLLLDLNMPGASGEALVKNVRAVSPHVPILVLTMHNEPQMAAKVLRAGANGFITKDSNLDVLLPAIKKVANRGNFLSPGMAEKIVFYEVPHGDAAPHTRMTRRELQIFEMLIKGMSISDIGALLGVSGKTVSTHKIRLLEKLQCVNMAELMRYAVHHNLLQ